MWCPRYMDLHDRDSILSSEFLLELNDYLSIYQKHGQFELQLSDRLPKKILEKHFSANTQVVIDYIIEAPIASF